ncbi:hypothetical protein [Flavobacterium okayamense]|uniref:GLPGLI family protein n=1 Tax=Flavobacterium okayamense TaxID=2830782 RepID=A0ABN6HS74_9FLAO|nr:hypothetical protein [Flavobacterium okayamense]BCY27479.1 hypothetical protein KK2020170_03470 [Flavobacterium okayamense]
MKKTFLILILFFSTFTFGQTITDITKRDTIYIYFKEGVNQKKKEANKNSYSVLEEKCNYEFKFDNRNFINLSERKYLDLDKYDSKIKSDIKSVKKSFLRRNKDIIIDLNFIKKYGLEQTYFLIRTKKIYLIDSSETNCNKILLKEVAFGRVSYSAQE